MKKTIIVLITTLLYLVNPAKAQEFSIDENGIVSCDGAQPGDTDEVNGILYEAVDRDLLIQRRDEYEDLSRRCTSLVTDMSNLFSGIENYNQDIGSWDVSNVTDMTRMFNDASSFNQDIGSWDVSSVEYMYSMFYGASTFNQDISGWNTASLIGIDNLFREANSFNQDVSSWDISKVWSLNGVFAYAISFNQSLTEWDVSHIRDMYSLFYGAESFNQDISGWDVSNVTDMTAMFRGANSFSHDVSGWDVGAVKEMNSMFADNITFNQDIGNWDVSSVTDMKSMFFGSNFNQDIGNWDVSSVTDMRDMFNQASNFNQDLSGWCVGLIESLPDNFARSSALNFDNMPRWGTCPGLDAPEYTLTESEGNVIISINNPTYRFYNIYASDESFNDINEQLFLTRIDTTIGKSFEHSLLLPHPYLDSLITVNYGIAAVTKSGFSGDLNFKSIEASTKIRTNFIAQLSYSETIEILDKIEENIFPDSNTIIDFFPDNYTPFEINTQSKLIEGVPADSDEDISGKFWVGYDASTSENYLLIYSEITDQMLVSTPSSAGIGGGWNYDSWEGAIGAYEPQSIFNGSDHDFFESGLEPDYLFRAGTMADAPPYIYVWDGGSGSINQSAPNSISIVDDSKSDRYRVLTILSTNALGDINTNARDFNFPINTDFTIVPFVLTLNDNDGGDRESQYVWGSRVTNNWWNTPKEWEVIALIGDTTLPSPPSRFNLLQPTNGTELETLLPEFKWNDTERAIGYRLEISDIIDFSSIIIDSSLTDTSFIPFEKLYNGTEYYWRVKAFGEGGASEWSEPFSFTIPVNVSNEIDELPTEFSLSQNFPNPFNPSTQISYTLPEATVIRLNVINNLGQHVATLVNERKSAGWHTVQFDASTLSSGLYFYTIKAGNFIQTRKMLLIK